eukprot:gene6014-16009_t
MEKELGRKKLLNEQEASEKRKLSEVEVTLATERTEWAEKERLWLEKERELVHAREQISEKILSVTADRDDQRKELEQLKQRFTEKSSQTHELEGELTA